MRNRRQVIKHQKIVLIRWAAPMLQECTGISCWSSVRTNQLINDLLCIARSLTNPSATDLISKLDEDDIEDDD